MKKLALIFISALLVLSLVLAGCTNAPANNDEKDNVNESENGDLVTYFENLEKKVEEYQAKEALDNEILATVGGIPVTAANVRYTTMVLKAPGEMSEEEAKEETEKFYKENAALVKVAFENGIELTEQNVNELQANIAGMQAQFGDEYDTIFAESPFTKFFYYFQTSAYQSLYSNIYESILADNENEMTKSSLEEAKSEMVRAKHILIQFPAGEGENGEMTDAQKQETLDKANAVLAEVNAMSDISEFDALIEKYNEDPGMTSNPDGYYFGKGEMVAPFEESAYALKEGETSGLVETSYGYHILLKLPLEDEEAIKNSNVFTNIFNEKLYESISARTEEFTVEYAENHDARVEEFVKEYEELMAAENAQAETAE